MDARPAKDAVGGSLANASESLSLWLVNDDPAQLMVQKRLLSRVATVEGYLSPVEALAAARSGDSSPFLITDFHMPGMDGPELARVWCELHPDARVLVISASEISRQERDRIEALPAAVRLLTSYRITDLQDQAKIWFQQAPSSDEHPSATSDASLLLDLTVLDKLKKLGGSAFVGKTVALFMQSGPRKLQGLEEALQAQDFRRMHELSHALRGSCGLVGAVTLSETAEKIETATAENGDVRGLENHVQNAKEQCQATLAALAAYQA